MSTPNPRAIRDQVAAVPATLEDWMDADKAQAVMMTLLKAAEEELVQSKHKHQQINHHAASVHTIAAESALREAGRIEAQLVEYQQRAETALEVPC